MGASQKTKQNQTSTFTPTPQAAAFYNNVFGQAQAAQSAYNPNTAKTVAGFTDPQSQAFANIAGNQGIWQPNVQAGGQAVADAGQGIAAGDISKFYNPYENDVIASTLANIRDEDAMQTRGFMANEAAQSGLGGNGVFLGRAQLQGDQAQARNATLANLRSAGFDKALGAAQADKTRGLQAGQAQAGIGQLMAQLAGSDASQLLASGNQQQQQQQTVNDTASQNALNEQLWPMQQAQWLAGIGAGIGPLMGGTTTGSGTATTSQGKGAGNIIGAGLSLASMASDERVKEDVQEVGATKDGQPIYSFRYRGDPRTQMGLMAQDVERGEHPEAVTEGIGGMKMVNYDTALQDAKADGGLALPQGLMGWANISPAQVRPPELASISAPQQKEEGFDPEAAMAMGKKAGAGIENLGKLFGGGSQMPMASSPAGGALAASGLQGLGGAGGGSGIMSALSSILGGFADGGAVDEDDPYRAAALRLRPKVIQVESGGDHSVVSDKGARGMMQIMPDTGRDPGYGVAPLRDESADENIRFGTDYLTAMLRRHKGDEPAALIAYNGGPKRADTWLAAGRNDAVIPRESADYYKKVQGTLGTAAADMVMKAKAPAANGAGMGEPYQGKADRASGGMLKRVFGIDFNPLNLTEPERKALFVAGLSMMSTGDVGKGGLMGMQYLTGVEAGEREARTEAQKLQYQLQKDAADLQLRTRAENRMETAEERQARQADRSYGLDLDKFNQGTKTEEQKLAWEREKQALDAGKPSEDMKEYAAYAKQETDAGRKPLGLFDYQVQLKSAGRSQTNVNVSGDKKGAEEMAKGYAKMYDGLRTNAEGARTLADNLDQVERAVNTGIQTGFAGDTMQSLRKFGAALGIADIQKVAAGELVQTISNRLALQVRAPGGESGGMPGAMSDADRTFLKETVPGLLKTPEGNRQVIAIMRVAAARHEAIFDMAVDYAEEHDGQLGPGFDRQVREFVKSNPLSKAVADTLNMPRPVTTTTVPGAPKGFTVEQVQ